MSCGLEAPSRVPKRDRHITADWFESPPTDYLNVSSLCYPRGLKPTLAEIDEKNSLVEVLRRKGHEGPFINSGQRKVDAIITLYLETNIDSLRDASTSNTRFVKMQIDSKQLLDTIRPATESIHGKIPDTVNDTYRFYPPFQDLFFAQGRIVETFKHANLESIKKRQLRTFVTVLRVVLEGLNEKLHGMERKKIIDFDHLWTLFPKGSFAVEDNHGTYPISQVVLNLIKLDPEKLMEQSTSFIFNSFEFDGHNIGTSGAVWEPEYFSNHVSVASLDYRPLKFEERVNPSVVKTAIESGRKYLNYQSHHYCHFTGPASPTLVTKGQTSFETKIDGRVIVDCLQAYRTKAVTESFFTSREDEITPVPGRTQEMHDGMRALFLTDKSRRPTSHEQAKRRMLYSAHDEYLMLFRQVIPAFSLQHDRWCKRLSYGYYKYRADVIVFVQVSGLSPVSFPEDPMSHLIDSNQRCMGLLNLLIQRSLSTICPIDEGEGLEEEVQRTALVIMFTGKTGTGKSATAEAIAELHRRPLVRFRMAKLIATTRAAQRSDFANLLELATAWNAFVLLEDAQMIFDQGDDGSCRDMAYDFAYMIRHFPGVVIMSRRVNGKMVNEMARQIQARIEFEEFSKEKRFRIWKALFGRRTQKEPSDCAALPTKVSEDTLHAMSEWRLDGHEIQHLFQSISLLWNDIGAKGITLSEIEELRALTCSPSKQAVDVKVKEMLDGETQTCSKES